MNRILLILVLFVFSLPVWAQDGKLTEGKRKEFEAQKVAFFTQEMNLSPEEAAVFWPLYNEMQQKMTEQWNKVKCTRDISDADMTEEMALKQITDIQAAEVRVQEIKKEYYARLIKAITAKKVWLMMKAERKFNHRLWKKVVDDARQSSSQSKDD